MTTNQNDWWQREFSLADNSKIDFLSRDGRTAVEVQQASNGRRGLYTAVMQMAIFLERNPSVRQGCLVLNRTRMSLDRLKDEWKLSKDVLQRSIAGRLCLIVIDNGETWMDPDNAYLKRVANVFAATTEHGDHVRGQQPGQKSYEIWKVLISRWLQKQGPIAIGELAEEVGCSYPTVRKALEKSSVRNALRVTSNRSVELKVFPHDLWNEIVALSHTLRKSIRFQDRSGEKPSSQALLSRLEKAKPPHLALGGVSAARHWHRNFNLHGTPRLDLLCHAPNGEVDLTFVQRLDPALAIVDDTSASAVLVVHPLARSASLFADNPAGKFPWADPVETALDLFDLSLTVQANQLLTHLRPEVRLG